MWSNPKTPPPNKKTKKQSLLICRTAQIDYNVYAAIQFSSFSEFSAVQLVANIKFVIIDMFSNMFVGQQD